MKLLEPGPKIGALFLDHLKGNQWGVDGALEFFVETLLVFAFAFFVFAIFSDWLKDERVLQTALRNFEEEGPPDRGEPAPHAADNCTPNRT